MAEVPPPPRDPPPPPPYPRGVIASVSGGVADTLKTLPPTLLLIVLLNMAFAGVGGFYLLKVEEYRAGDRRASNELLTKCLTETVHIDFLKLQNPKWSP